VSGEIIEGTAVQVNERPSDEHVIELEVNTGGETPLYLMLELDPNEGGNIGINLDSPWTTTHAKYLRVPGTWWLIDKQSRRAVMGVVVHPGDQPYFTKHHVGNLMVSRELIAYGLGKKCADGTMVRNWILPNGIVCGGDDVDIIASRMLEHQP
jgi:hypothetical protein